MTKNTQVSKKMSFALRHKPEEFGLPMREDGSVTVKELSEALDIPVPLIQQVVEEDSKKRFVIKEGRIWASQGHSFPVTVPLTPITVSDGIDILFHGTVEDFIGPIKEQGLIRGDREYVHLSRDNETAGQVAKRRKGEKHILRIKTREMLEEGFEIFLSENGVFLTREVPVRFIEF